MLINMLINMQLPYNSTTYLNNVLSSYNALTKLILITERTGCSIKRTKPYIWHSGSYFLEKLSEYKDRPLSACIIFYFYLYEKSMNLFFLLSYASARKAKNDIIIKNYLLCKKLIFKIDLFLC